MTRNPLTAGLQLRLLVTAALGLMLLFESEAPVIAESRGGKINTWNAEQLTWHSYETAIEQARKSGKPILFYVYADWCPHCRNLTKVFYKEEFVELAGGFVLARFDAETNAILRDRFAPDGRYVPQVFFLSPQGEPDFEIHNAGRDRFAHTFTVDEQPELYFAMREALIKYGQRGS